MMQLTYHPYRYYPYERELAAREVTALLGAFSFREHPNGLEIPDVSNPLAVDRLTYFAGSQNGQRYTETIQSKLETAARLGRKRQATRYSTHGLHEYKGKFNPQVARALLNIFGVRAGDAVLDPFCGSGTSLIECAHLGAHGYGTDINPLSVFIANAKLLALTTPESALRECLLGVKIRLSFDRAIDLGNSPREKYLRGWFDHDTLCIVERLASAIGEAMGAFAPIFLAIASNLLRDYSLQDPMDLRIRRRKTPLPEVPLLDAFTSSCESFLERLKSTQEILGTNLPAGHAVLSDVRALPIVAGSGSFDAAVTSPPYAMALPYIDTQRLSLVWLRLIPPDQILKLESELIGSREMRRREAQEVMHQMLENAAGLPGESADFCLRLQHALAESDGFRRQAVPTLLYRYFAGMLGCFNAVKQVMKHGANFGLIVGHNHTVLGGRRRDIDTPHHLALLAKHAGWTVKELTALQTYQRYGYHVTNAVAAETLLILQNT